MSQPFQQPFANRIVSIYDVWVNILSRSSLAEHLPIARTCHLLNDTIRSYAEHRFHTTLQPFGLNALKTRDLLRDSNSVISGSFALSYIFGSIHTDWNPDDLDIYVSRQGLCSILEGLHEEGYTALDTIVTSSLDYDGNEIERIIRLGNSARRIDVMVSRTSSPIAPIFQFHSTLVMNYVSADSFFSAYPSLTLYSIGLINPLVEFRKRLTPSTLLSIYKYLQRGYRLRSPSAFWLVDKIKSQSFGHICGICTTCPYTKRTNDDKGCLIAAITSELSTSQDLRKIEAQRMKVTWLLSIERCDGERGYRLILPYIRVHDDNAF